MMKGRMLELSFFQGVTDIFRNPLAATATQPSWVGPWNIYDESDLRAGTVPTFPFLYLIDAGSIDLNLATPVILIDFAISMDHFTLDMGGSNFAKAPRVILHIIGTNKAESKDISSYIADTLRSLPVYDYNNPTKTGIYPTLDTRPASAGLLPDPYYPVIQTLQIDPFIGQSRLNVSKNQKFQGMLSAAQLLQLRFVSSF